MSHFSYRRLHHDLHLGYRLSMFRYAHRAYGFRGSEKGKGFQAYCTANGIDRRHAYRLIERYRKLKAIWDTVHVSNEELREELFSLSSLAELEAVIERGIRDNGTVPNAEVR